jgi:hypothetical protein
MVTPGMTIVAPGMAIGPPGKFTRRMSLMRRVDVPRGRYMVETPIIESIHFAQCCYLAPEVATTNVRG